MKAIAGLDLSLSSTGLALPSGDLATIATKVPPRATPADKARRLNEISAAVAARFRLHPPRPDLVIIEGYANHSPGIQALLGLAELGGVTKLRLFELAIDFVIIAPTALKRYATGNGSARKEAMIAAAVELGARPANDDEADAFLLRHLGRSAYGLEAATKVAHRLEVVAAQEWP